MSDFGFLTLRQVQDCLEIVLDIGTVQDELDEVERWAKDPERTWGGPEEEPLDEHIAWMASEIGTLKTTREKLLARLMEWCGSVELGESQEPQEDALARIMAELAHHS